MMGRPNNEFNRGHSYRTDNFVSYALVICEMFITKDDRRLFYVVHSFKRTNGEWEIVFNITPRPFPLVVGDTVTLQMLSVDIANIQAKITFVSSDGFTIRVSFDDKRETKFEYIDGAVMVK